MRWVGALAIAALFVAGCRHEERIVNTGRLDSKGNLNQANGRAASQSPMVLEVSSRAGVPVYPDALVDSSKTQSCQHLGQVDRYTVPMVTTDPIDKVANYYVQVLNGSYDGGRTSGRVTATTPSGANLSILLQNAPSGGTDICIYASVPNSIKTPETKTTSAQTGSASQPAPVMQNRPQPIYRIDPNQGSGDPQATDSDSGGQSGTGP